MKHITKETSTKLIFSEDDNNELRAKFATVGEQMEVMLATEAKDTNESIFALQSKLQSMRKKSVEKLKSCKQVEKSLKLELSNALDQLESGRRTTTTLAEQNQKLTSEVETTSARLSAAMMEAKSLRKDLRIEEKMEVS